MRYRYFAVALLATALLGLILAACGGDEPADEPLPAAPTSQAEENAASGVAVGQAAPDFTLGASDGSHVSLAGYQGQPVLLFFHMAAG